MMSALELGEEEDVESPSLPEYCLLLICKYKHGVMLKRPRDALTSLSQKRFPCMFSYM